MSLLGLSLLATTDYAEKDASLRPVASASPMDVTQLFKTITFIGQTSGIELPTDVDLATNGGLIIAYNREASSPVIFLDSENGWDYSLNTSSRNGKVLKMERDSLTVEATKLTIVTDYSSSILNKPDAGCVMYLFKRAERFLDIVTYIGNDDVFRTLAHNLTIKPGLIIIKKTTNTANTTADNWYVWNAYSGLSYINVYSDGVLAETGLIFTNTPSDEDNFYVGSTLNALDCAYTAYIFADDRSDTGVIRTGVVFGRTAINRGSNYVGWESQFLMQKHLDLSSTVTYSTWIITDASRGMGKFSIAKNLKDDTVEIEHMQGGLLTIGNELIPDANGFTYDNSLYQYLTIRKPPPIIPTSGLDVLHIESVTQRNIQKTSNCPFEPDFAYISSRATTPSAEYINLLGLKDTSFGNESFGAYAFHTNGTAPLSSKYIALSNDSKNMMMQGVGWDDPAYGAFIYFLMRKAIGFLDVLNYIGTFEANRTVKHSLGAVPEMIIIKPRNIVGAIIIQIPLIGSNYYLQMNTSAGKVTNLLAWSNTLPTVDSFTIGKLAAVNTLNQEYSAMLFGSIPGISKIGVYTGNASNQIVDCGFTTGARFVLIKAHNSTGNWTLHDTVRGIVIGNDVYNNLNTVLAEVKNRDSLEYASSGFKVIHNTTSNLNVNARLYVYLAIA